MNETLRNALMAFLSRKAIPQRLVGEQAQADELRALLQALHRAAPVSHPSPEWADDFLGHLERRERAPVWPSVADIERLATERRKELPTAGDVKAALFGAALFAKRMTAREPVAEADLWGPVALEAWRQYGVSPEDITTLRSACVEARAALYGREVAAAWLGDQARRWADAKAAYGKPSDKTVSAERRAELVEWAREAVHWERIEDATEEPFRTIPEPENLEAVRDANPVIQAARAAQQQQRKATPAPADVAPA